VNPGSEAITVWRGVLIGAGVILLLTGAATFLMQVPSARYPGVAAWLAGAIVVHDGIVSMLVFAIAVLLRRLDRRIPPVVLAIVQAAAVVAAIVTAIVLPEIVKQSIGTANPTILPLAYGAHLLWFYGVLIGASAVSIGVYLVAVRLRRRSTSGTS
jgi:MFS superfamily sulfate permease-like transporter